jgi:mannosyltransferase OCH1-like enzyme
MEFIIKPDCKELFLLHKHGLLTNYFMASAKNNPNLDHVVGAILENIDKSTSKDLSEITGPAMLDRALRGRHITKAYYKYTSYQGTFTNEFFQYVDHPQGKWTSTQKSIDVIRR